jgi:hypothetical protein
MGTTEESGVTHAMPLHIHMSRVQLSVAQRVENVISILYMPGLEAESPITSRSIEKAGAGSQHSRWER